MRSSFARSRRFAPTSISSNRSMNCSGRGPLRCSNRSPNAWTRFALSKLSTREDAEDTEAVLSASFLRVLRSSVVERLRHYDPVVSALDAVIFDFDGVILDSETPEYESNRLIYERCGATLTVEEWCSQIGIYTEGEEQRWFLRLCERV